MARDFDWSKALRGELGEDARKNTEWLKGISENLDAVAEGRMYTDGDGFRIVEDGEEPPEDWERVDMFEYFAENYGMTYTLDDYLRLKGCTVMVAFGGPNIYVDTNKELVEMHWWTTYACYPLSEKACEAVDEFAQDVLEVKGVKEETR